MIEFDRKFFEDEVRDGFYVGSEVKRIWAAEMEVLMEIDRICKKYNIPYFAEYGTLLGAVRHNGYIPWDDDMDIVMMRNDYMRFLSVAKKELSYPFYCADIYHAEQWDQPFARVMNGSGINLDQGFLARFHGCAYPAGVDIFVFDNMPKTEDEFYTIVGLFNWVWNVKALLEERKKAKKEEKEAGSVLEVEEDLKKETQIEDLLCQIENDCKVTIDREKNIENQLLRIIDGLFALNDEESDEIVNMSYAPRKDYHYVGKKREWYREAIELPFESITIPVPIDFRESIEKSFGVNYLTPVIFGSHGLLKKYQEELRMCRRDIRNINGKMDKLYRILEEGQGEL